MGPEVSTEPQDFERETQLNTLMNSTKFSNLNSQKESELHSGIGNGLDAINEADESFDENDLQKLRLSRKQNSVHDRQRLITRQTQIDLTKV